MVSLLVRQTGIRFKVRYADLFLLGKRIVLAEKNVRLCSEEGFEGKVVILKSFPYYSLVKCVYIDNPDLTS